MLAARFERDTEGLQLLAREDQHGYLRAMYGFLAPLEEMFAADTILDGHGLASRRKAPKLLRDLRALGDYTPPVWCTELPDASTLARRIGIAYVLYGTRLAAAADQLLVTRAAEDDALLAAQETFDKLRDWLASCACRGSATTPSSPDTPAAAH